MEQYLWMAIGCVIVGFFINTYWDVYQAYRAYNSALPTESKNELVQIPQMTSAPNPTTTAQSPISWLLEKGDRFLHAMLMSPTSR